MGILSYSRGHLCEYRDGKWVYFDNGYSVGNKVRPCKKCGRMPTPEGYDACLGYIQGATSACCGHGTNKGFVL